MACIIGRKVVNPRYKKIAPNRHFALYGHRDDYFVPIDCGRCINCLKKYLSSWRFRILEEFKGYDKDMLSRSYFITFTLEPRYYTEKKPLLKKYVRQFLEYVRFKTGKSPRHFFITERGEQKGRLHFHGFLFNINFNSNLLSKYWKYGFIKVYPVLDPSCPVGRRVSYCTSYITNSDKTKTKLDYIISPEDYPLVLVSPGLGKSYSDRAKDFHHQRNQLIPFADNGSRLCSLPRYLRQKVFTESELSDLSRNYFLNLSEDVIPDGPYYIGSRQYNDYSSYLNDIKPIIQKYNSIYGK